MFSASSHRNFLMAHKFTGKRRRGGAAFSRRRSKPAKRARRGVRRAVRPSRRRLKTNQEVKSSIHEVRVDELGFMAGSVAAGPANSLCLLAGLFGGDKDVAADVSTGLVPGAGCFDIVGCFITPAYPSSMKLDISYKELVVVDGEAYPNPNLRVMHGFYKNTGDKMSADLTNNSTWIKSVRVALLKELFEADYTADYLAYTRKSRNIKILSDRLIRPKKAVAVQMPHSDSSSIVAPNSQLKYKWPHSKVKTRMAQSQESGVDPRVRMVPHNLWVPFLLMLVPGIPADIGDPPTDTYGHLRVRSVTKAYFNDT